MIDDNPLTWRIEAQATGRENTTMWGTFKPPESMYSSLAWAKPLCWNIYACVGKTLADLMDAETRRCGDSNNKIMERLHKLEDRGVIVVVPGRIILRRTVAGPLERLAACAD